MLGCTLKRPIFPDPVLQDLTRLVMRNGVEDPIAWSTILSVLSLGDGERALVASQMARTDSPSFTNFVVYS